MYKTKHDKLLTVFIMISFIIATLFLYLFFNQENTKYAIIGIPNSWTNEDVLIKIEASEGYLYSFGDSEFTEQSTFLIENNVNKFKIKLKDERGHIYDYNLDIDLIDKESPIVFKVQTNLETNEKEKYFEIEASDSLSGIKEYGYYLDDEFFPCPSKRVIIKGTINDTFKLVVIDNANNIKTIDPQFYTKNVDNFTVIKTPENLTNKNVLMTIVSSKDLKGYSYNNGEYITNNTYSVETNGTYIIKVKDYLGNEYTKNIVIDNIDKSIPTLNVIKKVENNRVLITLTSSDDKELDSKMYSWNYGAFTSDNSQVFITNVSNYSIRVRDRAGNITTKIIDITEITNEETILSKDVLFQINKSNSDLTNENVTVTVVTDNENLISFNNGPFNTNNSISIESNVNDYSIRVKNNANVIKEQKISISNIDKTKPILNYTQNITEKTDENVTITLISSDNISLPENKYSYNNGEFTNNSTYTFTTNVNNFSIRVKDSAGNITEKIISISNIGIEKTYKDKNIEIIAEIKKNYGFDINYGEETFFWYGGNCTVLTDEKRANEALNAIKNSLSNFPVGFFNIFQGKNGYSVLLMDDIPNDTAGVASPEIPGDNQLVLNVNAWPLNRVFYHETFHMIEYLINYMYQDNGINHPFKDWSSLNPIDFNYNNSDTSDNTYTVSATDTDIINHSFISSYSKKNEREDRAELFADLMFRATRYSYMNEGYGVYKKAQALTKVLNNIWSNNIDCGWNRFVN